MSADAVPDRRERLVRPLFIAFLVASAVDLVGLLADVPAAHLVAKPLLMPLLAGYAAARRGPRLLIAALLFGWGGDTFLLADADAAFLVGMGSFAVGHVCYLWLFGRARGSLPTGIVYAVVLVTFVALLWPGLPADMRIPMTGYSLLLTAMAYRAGDFGRYAAAAWSALPALRRADRHRHRGLAAAARPRLLGHAHLHRRAVPADRRSARTRV